MATLKYDERGDGAKIEPYSRWECLASESVILPFYFMKSTQTIVYKVNFII